MRGLHLQKLTELLDRKAGIACNTAHGECVDGVVAWNNHDSLAVAHDDVLALAHDSKAGLLECSYGVEVIDAGNLRQS